MLVVLSPVWAQAPLKGQVSGLVKDASGKPLEFVSMMLVKAGDSTLVKGDVSDAAGKYSFDHVAEGAYRVVATQLGFRKTLSEIIRLDGAQATIVLPDLVMAESTKVLSEVTVTAKKPFIEQQIDRMVVNVENSIVASGNTALEVLEKAPGVTIDRQNDQIQLKGKQGVIVMIDGKQTYLSGQEVTNLLKSTPSDNIEKIEIITNPSSKYDAAGNSGIINIRMKKNKNFGTNGSATVGVGYGRFEKTNQSLRLNHREGKINVFGNYSFYRNRSFQENELSRIIPFEGSVSYFDQVSSRPNWSDGHNYRGGLDYFFNAKSTLGVLVSGFSNRWNQENAMNYSIIRNEAGLITLRPTTGVTVLNQRSNLTGNLNYKYDFDGKGRELTADMDYSRFVGDSYNELITTYPDDNGNITRPTDQIRNTMPSVIDIWAFKSDYVHPTKGGGKWEGGIKSSFVRADNNLLFDNFLDAQWVLDDTKSNQFKYQENINAAYLNYAGKLSKKTSLQLGLRAEHTHSKGHSVTLNKIVDQDYINLFPTFFLSRQLDTSNVLNLSYSRRIDRPNYQDLNPFVFYLDPYTYQQGNPYLRPQYTHSMQLTHVYKGSFSTTLGYSRTTDVIVREVPGQIPEKKIAFVTADNLATQDNVNLTLSFPLPVTKWWMMQNNLTVMYSKYNSPYLGEQYSMDVVAWNAYVSNSFTLGKGFSAELAGWYNSAGLYGFFANQAMGAFSVGVQKSLFQKKGTLKLNINDPFWLNQFRGSTQYQDINFTIRSRWESRIARLTFTYNFGNQNVKAARQRSTSTEAERNRAGGNN
jgi:hypothetical protein